MTIASDAITPERDLFGHERRVAGIIGELRAEGDGLSFCGPRRRLQQAGVDR